MSEADYWKLANDASHAAITLDNIRLKRCDDVKPIFVISALIRDNIPKDSEGADHPHIDISLLLTLEEGYKVKSSTVAECVKRALATARRLEEVANNRTYDAELLQFLLDLSKRAGVKSHVGWRRRCLA